ncbi:MAG: hypothetical protein ABII12_13950 [Planctomycetota bacterium]
MYDHVSEVNKQKDDDMANKSERRRFWRKDWWKNRRIGWQQGWRLALYVAGAYWVLVEGAACTNTRCYDSLKSEADRLLVQLQLADEKKHPPVLKVVYKDPRELENVLDDLVMKKIARSDKGLDDNAIAKAERLIELYDALLFKATKGETDNQASPTTNEAKNQETASQPSPTTNGADRRETNSQRGAISNAEKDFTILTDGPSSFSSASPHYVLIFFPGFLVFLGIISIHVLVNPSPYRAALIILVFVPLCCGVDAWHNDIMGLKLWPSFTVLLTSFYWVALFWFIDRIVFNEEFEVALKTANGDREKCKALYDFAIFYTKAVATIFLAICIVQGWQLSEAHRHLYENAGVIQAKTTISVVLIFYGSLGWLGWVGLKSGSRAWQATQAAAGVPQESELIT